MRASLRLGGVVLLLLSVSGCAAVQSRMNGPARNPEDPPPSRSSGWFGSKFWGRPTPTSAAATAVTPDVEPARPAAPETDIWPAPKSSGLSRLVPILGNRDRGQKTPTAGDVYPDLASLATPAATSQRDNDSQVKPVSGDATPEDATTRGPTARTKAANSAQGDDPVLLPSPIAVQVPVQRQVRTEPRGTVALEVEPADLDDGDGATRGTSPRNLAVNPTLEHPEIGQPTPVEPARKRPRREDYLIATAASVADATATGSEPAQPSTSSPQPAGSAVSQQPKPPTPKPSATAPSTTPSTGPPPPPLGPSTPSTGPPPPPLGPATSPPPAMNSAPVPPTPPVPSLPAQAPAPATVTPPVPVSPPVPVPAPEPPPTAEPGPKPASSTPEPEPPATDAPAPASVPAGQGLAASPAPAPAPTASGQGSQALAQAAPSPQASVRPAGKPAKPAHKSCWLLDWVHSWHKPAKQPPQPDCQLPPVTFPTTYQTCMPGPGPAGQMLAGSVHPAPQSSQASAPHSCSCTTKTPKAQCFSWFHYGMASDFFAKVRGWRHACACHCRDSEFRLWWGNCKRCASKCTGPHTPTASPQASSSPVWPQSQSGMGSWSPVPGNLAEGNQVLERIASQGLDKTP